MATLNDLLVDILNHAEADAEKTIQYAAMNLSMRRRIRAALDLLEAGRTDEAADMLVTALADDGSLMRQRLDKITRKVFNESLSHRQREQRALRLKLRDVLYRLKPRANAIEIFTAVDEVLRVVGQEPLEVLAEDPVPGCACWLCVLRLNASAVQEQARREVEHEDVEWVATER